LNENPSVQERSQLVQVVNNFKYWANKNLSVYRFLKLRLGVKGTLRAYPYEILDQADPNLIDTFEPYDQITYNAISEMRNLLDEEGIDFYVVIIPRQEQISIEAWESFKSYYGVSDVELDRRLPHQRFISNTLEPLQIPYIDLLDLLEGKNGSDFYFKNDGHLNEQGHRFVAEVMTDWMMEIYNQSCCLADDTLNE
jgi:hypothetical protein